MKIDTAQESDLPGVEWVQPEQLDECLAQGGSLEVEKAARLMLWRHLNHPYRERYRVHRDAEDAANSVSEEVVIMPEPPPDQRGWFRCLIGVKPPKAKHYKRTRRREGAPFATPPFEPSPEATDNLERLFGLTKREDAMPPGDAVLAAEVSRELGRFEDAANFLPKEAPEISSVTWRLIGELIAERRRDPVRYRH